MHEHLGRLKNKLKCWVKAQLWDIFNCKNTTWKSNFPIYVLTHITKWVQCSLTYLAAKVSIAHLICKETASVNRTKFPKVGRPHWKKTPNQFDLVRSRNSLLKLHSVVWLQIAVCTMKLGEESEFPGITPAHYSGSVLCSEGIISRQSNKKPRPELTCHQ